MYVLQFVPLECANKVIYSSHNVPVLLCGLPTYVHILSIYVRIFYYLSYLKV